jgi:hypothetical protein
MDTTKTLSLVARTEAAFLGLSIDSVAALAQRVQTAADDVDSQAASTSATHGGERCSFEALIKRDHQRQDDKHNWAPQGVDA